MKSLISTIAFLSISILGFSQLEKEGTNVQNGIGFRLTFKHASAFYQQRLNSNTSFYAEAGYEWRYFERYDRIEVIRFGLIPTLASAGPIGEAGIVFHGKKSDFNLGLQYKFSHILEGTDNAWEWGNTYSRDDHKIALKTFWTLNPEDRVNFYTGLGLRWVKSFEWDIDETRSYSAPYTRSRFWIAPTIHLGFRVRILSF